MDFKADRGSFGILIGELALSFRTEAGFATINTYFEKLKDLSMYQVDMAINKIIDQGERFPTVSGIKKVARTYPRQPLRADRHIPLIEMQVPDDAPRSKEEFLKAMNKLMNDVDINKSEEKVND